MHKDDLTIPSSMSVKECLTFLRAQSHADMHIVNSCLWSTTEDQDMWHRARPITIPWEEVCWILPCKVLNGQCCQVVVIQAFAFNLSTHGGTGGWSVWVWGLQSEFQDGQGYTEKSYPENPKSSMFQRRTLLFFVIFTQTQIFSYARM